MDVLAEYPAAGAVCDATPVEQGYAVHLPKIKKMNCCFYTLQAGRQGRGYFSLNILGVMPNLLLNTVEK